jgi:hypothetical protein
MTSTCAFMNTDIRLRSCVPRAHPLHRTSQLSLATLPFVFGQRDFITDLRRRQTLRIVVQPGGSVLGRIPCRAGCQVASQQFRTHVGDTGDDNGIRVLLEDDEAGGFFG